MRFEFNDDATRQRVARTIMEHAQCTGVIRGRERWGLYFDEPIGQLLGAGVDAQPLRYAEMKVIDDRGYLLAKRGPAEVFVPELGDDYVAPQPVRREHWQDVTVDPPYDLELVGDGDRFEIRDSEDPDAVVHVAASYMEAKLWLIEDGYELAAASGHPFRELSGVISGGGKPPSFAWSPPAPGSETDRPPTARQIWATDVAALERIDGLRDVAAAMRAGGPPPLEQAEPVVPLILDTDIGGDPDDAIAVALAARRFPELALVITSDECGGERALFARHFLDRMGRQDVPVVAGADLGNTRYFVVDGLTPASVGAQPDNVATAVAQVTDSGRRRACWVGMEPVSNWAQLCQAHSELAEAIDVVQMGGAINYRDPERAEHNFRLDADAARALLAAPRRATSRW